MKFFHLISRLAASQTLSAFTRGLLASFCLPLACMSTLAQERDLEDMSDAVNQLFQAYQNDPTESRFVEYQGTLQAAICQCRISFDDAEKNVRRINELHHTTRSLDPCIARSRAIEVILLENAQMFREGANKYHAARASFQTTNRWQDLLELNYIIGSNRYSNYVLDYGIEPFLNNERLIEEGKIFQKSSPYKYTTPTGTTTLGLIYMRSGRYDSAAHYFRIAFKRAQDPVNKIWYGLSAGNLGEAYSKLGLLDSAHFYLQLDANESSKDGNAESAALAYLALARWAAAVRNIRLGQLYIDSANWVLTKRTKPDVLTGNRLSWEVLEAEALLTARSGPLDSVYNALNRVLVNHGQLVWERNRQQKIAQVSRYYQEFQLRKLWEIEKRYHRRSGLAWVVLTLLVVSSVWIFALLRLNGKLRKANESVALQTRRLEELNIQKNKVFQVVAHDLRSPISNLQGILGLSQSELISEQEFLTYRDEISGSVGALLGTMENLLHWANLGMNQGLTPKNSALDMQEVIQQVVIVARQQAEYKGIKILTEVAENAIVWGDKGMLIVIIRNLLVNAIKFSNLNGTIYVDAYPVSDGSDIVCSVRDEGVGIAQDLIRDLFSDEFVLKSTSGTEGEKGTGIGLRIVKEFVELMGGRVFVTSQPEKGSTFYFQIPGAAKQKPI